MSDNKKDDIQKQIDSLVCARDRTGKEPLTTEERLQLLNEIYDGLLIFWKQLILMGSAKGSSAIQYQLERARLEMVDLERTHGGAENTDTDTIGWGDIESENLAINA